MSLTQIGRAGLAVVVSLLLSILALRFISGAPEKAPSPPAEVNLQPTLSLIRQSTTGQLISLQISPFEVGQNSFRVTMLSPLGGRPLEAGSAVLRLSSLESADAVDEISASGSETSKGGHFLLPRPGWWQVDAIIDGASVATFYLKLDQPSQAPQAFAPPGYSSDAQAEEVFRAAMARYEGLAGLKWREELTSGIEGPSGLGVWFITDLDANDEGYHARTLNMDQGGSELYGDRSRQCFRQSLEPWQCSDGPSPIGPFELSYLYNATAFKLGRQEVVDGEVTRVIFFYSPSQRAWYAWWVGEQTQFLRRQAMIATGHFMLDRYTDHDIPAEIRPSDLAFN